MIWRSPDDVIININNANSQWKICFFFFFPLGEKLLINVIKSQVHKNVTYSLFLGPGIINFCKKKIEIFLPHFYLDFRGEALFLVHFRIGCGNLLPFNAKFFLGILKYDTTLKF